MEQLLEHSKIELPALAVGQRLDILGSRYPVKQGEYFDREIGLAEKVSSDIVAFGIVDERAHETFLNDQIAVGRFSLLQNKIALLVCNTFMCVDEAVQLLWPDHRVSVYLIQ